MFSASFRRRSERHILGQKIRDVVVIVFPGVGVRLEDENQCKIFNRKGITYEINEVRCGVKHLMLTSKSTPVELSVLNYFGDNVFEKFVESSKIIFP